MQVKSMQERDTQVALRATSKAHTLAQRRAEFVAQVQAMATDDLSNVKRRLKTLRQELHEKTGEPWTQQDVAQAVGVPLRTFASWEGGEVENRDGEGYKKIAKFYSRKLGRKVTWTWIVFGDEPPKDSPVPTPDVIGALSPSGPPELAQQVRELQSETAELHAELSAVRTDLQLVLSLLQRGERGQGDGRS